VVIDVEIDNCCGGGHCGPVPGYTYECPVCEKSTMCRTRNGRALDVDESLTCSLCKEEITVVEVLSDGTFDFDFEL
jgi:hypothetical protein